MLLVSFGVNIQAGQAIPAHVTKMSRYYTRCRAVRAMHCNRGFPWVAHECYNRHLSGGGVAVEHVAFIQI